MNQSKYKTILMPIQVPYGDYCWRGTMQGACCDYFDNHGGGQRCSKGFYGLINAASGGVLKPDICKNLKQSKS